MGKNCYLMAQLIFQVSFVQSMQIHINLSKQLLFQGKCIDLAGSSKMHKT